LIKKSVLESAFEKEKEKKDRLMFQLQPFSSHSDKKSNGVQTLYLTTPSVCLVYHLIQHKAMLRHLNSVCLLGLASHFSQSYQRAISRSKLRGSNIYSICIVP